MLIKPGYKKFWTAPAVHGKAAAVGYQGIGNVQSGATAWYGLRAYNAAYATGSNPCVDIVDQAGANALTVNILSTGALDVATISTWVTAHTVTTIKIAKMYDQVGTNHLACVAGTVGTMPKLVLSGFGSLPVVRFDGTFDLQSANNITQTDPYTLSTTAKRTSGTSLGQVMGCLNGNGVFFDGSGTLALYDGGGVVDFGGGSVTENTFHTIQGVLNGASSIGQYDATVTNPVSGSPGSGGFPTALLNVNNSSFHSLMDWVEGGLWSGDKHTTFGAVHTNSSAYWGY